MPDWPLLLGYSLVALITGAAKTGIPGMGILSVVLLANLMPGETQLSVGTLLPLLIAADIFAVAVYRRHAEWGHIRKLLPWIAVGIGIGSFALDLKQGFDQLLGGLVLVLLGVDLLMRNGKMKQVPHHAVFAAFMGIATGFATTIGNAAGPIATVYLLSQGFDKHRFIGSMAWLFLIVNCSKVPLFACKGMITSETLIFDLYMIPGIIIGTMIGRKIFQVVSEKLFVNLVLVLAALSALRLMF